jgi:hypothetical protein
LSNTSDFNGETTFVIVFLLIFSLCLVVSRSISFFTLLLLLLGPVPADFFSAHIECFNSLSHTSVGANAVDMNLVFINVVDDEI